MSHSVLHTMWVGLQDQCAAAVIVGGIASVLGCLALCASRLATHVLAGVQAKWALLTPRAAGLRRDRTVLR